MMYSVSWLCTSSLRVMQMSLSGAACMV